MAAALRSDQRSTCTCLRCHFRHSLAHLESWGRSKTLSTTTWSIGAVLQWLHCQCLRTTLEREIRVQDGDQGGAEEGTSVFPTRYECIQTKLFKLAGIAGKLQLSDMADTLAAAEGVFGHGQRPSPFYLGCPRREKHLRLYVCSYKMMRTDRLCRAFYHCEYYRILSEMRLLNDRQRGPSDSPYAGGEYHGLIMFPNDYRTLWMFSCCS